MWKVDSDGKESVNLPPVMGSDLDSPMTSADGAPINVTE